MPPPRRPSATFLNRRFATSSTRHLLKRETSPPFSIWEASRSVLIKELALHGGVHSAAVAFLTLNARGSRSRVTPARLLARKSIAIWTLSTWQLRNVLRAIILMSALRTLRTSIGVCARSLRKSSSTTLSAAWSSALLTKKTAGMPPSTSASRTRAIERTEPTILPAKDALPTWLASGSSWLSAAAAFASSQSLLASSSIACAASPATSSSSLQLLLALTETLNSCFLSKFQLMAH